MWRSTGNDVLHIRRGDDLRAKLGPAGFPGDYLTWIDPVCQGPLPDVPDDAFDAVRAEFLAMEYGFDPVATRERLRVERAGFDRLDGYQRIVLWFDHSWSDQSVLIRLLALLARRPVLHDRIFLLSVDDFSGERAFFGYGQLDPVQLGQLAGQEQLVTAEQYALASAAWAALRSPSPLELQTILDGDGLALPYLGMAIRRHLHELPWTTDGFSLSERLCLRAISAGLASFAEIFQAHQGADPLPYLGDSMLRPVLARLAAGANPALAVSGSRYALTEFGGAAMAGLGRWLSGQRWVGGVRVPTAWGFDPTEDRVVPAAG